MDAHDILTAMENWGLALRAKNLKRTLRHYAEDGVLWGTFSETRRDTPEQISGYFEKLFDNENLNVSFENSNVRFYGDTAVNSGSYTFSCTENGKTISVPARYSFMYVLRDGKWLIVDHHSSVVPGGH